MYKLYELSEGQANYTFKLLAEDNRNVLGKLMNSNYNTLRMRGGRRVRIIYAIYDINKTLTTATGPR